MILIFYCLRITLNSPALVVEKFKCWNDVCILICSLIECYENGMVCMRINVRMFQVFGIVNEDT